MKTDHVAGGTAGAGGSARGVSGSGQRRGTAVESSPETTHRNAMYVVIVVLLPWLAEFHRYSVRALWKCRAEK